MNDKWFKDINIYISVYCCQYICDININIYTKAISFV